MKKFAIVCACAAFLAPSALSEETTTLKEVTTKGVIIEVQGQAIDIDYNEDGTFSGMGGAFAGTWKIDGAKLCLTIPGMVENQCTEYPEGKKAGDTFEVQGEMGAMNVTIRGG
jgi:heat shock protein HslJ